MNQIHSDKYQKEIKHPSKIHTREDEDDEEFKGDKVE